MSTTITPQQNHLLGALPPEVLDRLRPYFELIELPLGKVLYESGDALRHVFFPTHAIVSLLYVMESGSSAEISVVGNEGMVGIAVFMGGESTPSRAIVQSAGYAFRLAGSHFKNEVNRHAELLQLM
ncbi:Crp/Fnr family transcriptional regulator, partial [Vogesella sp. GCM10023246]